MLFLLTANLMWVMPARADRPAIGLFLDVSSNVRDDLTAYKRNALQVVDRFMGPGTRWSFVRAGDDTALIFDNTNAIKAAIARSDVVRHAELEGPLWAITESLIGGSPSTLVVQTDLYTGRENSVKEILTHIQRTGIRTLMLVKPGRVSDIDPVRAIVEAGGGLVLDYTTEGDLIGANSIILSTIESTERLVHFSSADSGVASFPIDPSIQSFFVLLRGKGAERLVLIDPKGSEILANKVTGQAYYVQVTDPAPGLWTASYLGWGNLSVDIFVQTSVGSITHTVKDQGVVYDVLVPPEVKSLKGQLALIPLNGMETSKKSLEVKKVKDGFRASVDWGPLPKGSYRIVSTFESPGEYLRTHTFFHFVGRARPALLHVDPSAMTTRQAADKTQIGFTVVTDNAQQIEFFLGVNGQDLRVEKMRGRAYSSAGLSMARYSALSDLSEGWHKADVRMRTDFGVVPVYSWEFGIDKNHAEKILIGEVQPDGKDGFWVELEALKGPQDISRLAVGSLASSEKRTSVLAEEPVTLNEGDRVVVRWHETGIDETDLQGDVNSNQIREVYIQNFGEPTKNGGTIVVRENDVILDAVVYMKESMGSRESMEKDALIRMGEWQGEPVKIGERGQSTGRDGRKDLNRATDFSIYITPSPGQRNRASRNKIPARGDVLINEVYMGAGTKWAELVCVNGPIDASFLKVSNLDGRDDVLAQSPVTLKEGDMAVVYWKEGEDETDEVGDKNQNGIRELYLGDPPPHATDDQLALMYVNDILDAVVFSDYDGDMSVQQVKDAQSLVAKGEWKGEFGRTEQSGAVKLPNEREASIGRSGIKDSNDKEDWRIVSKVTPGDENKVEEIYRKQVFEVKIIEVQPKATPLAYAVLYVDTGEGDISSAILTDMDAKDDVLADKRIWLRAGDKITVWWGQGVDETDEVGDANKNGTRELFIEKDPPPTATDDQLVLMLSGEILDAVCWANGDGRIAQPELGDISELVGKGHWSGSFSSGDESELAVYAGSALTRMKNKDKYVDTNSAKDWK